MQSSYAHLSPRRDVFVSPLMREMSRPNSFVRIISALTRNTLRIETCEMVSKDFQIKPPATPLTIAKPGMSATAAFFPMYAKLPLCTYSNLPSFSLLRRSASASQALKNPARYSPSCFATCAVAGRARNPLSTSVSMFSNPTNVHRFVLASACFTKLASMLLITSSRCGNSSTPPASAAFTVSLSRVNSQASPASSHFAAVRNSSRALAIDRGRSMVAQSPIANIVPLLPLTRKFLSVARDRRFSCDPAGSASMIFSQSGFNLMPLHHTDRPAGMVSTTPVMESFITTDPSLTSRTCLFKRHSMFAL
mmetsp:Transcript_12206/g.45420  ORF Transcript_12206/g.45420 Transcript_12206/m.45420 type:complete len:307 (+) Transcript_12206:211-1131(+)